MIPGLGHTAPLYAPAAQNHMMPPLFNNGQYFTSAASPTHPFWMQGGLSHSANYGMDYTDPYAMSRVAQTFPYAHWAYSPFAWPTI
jgi:hypothetical protein